MKSDTLKKEANVNFYKVSIEFYKFCVTVRMWNLIAGSFTNNVLF